jgi:hypothetical protein
VNETAIVLFVKHTGHVLATATRTGDPAAAPSAAELAGELFPVRDDGGDVLVEIEAGELESKVVPFDEDLVLSPQLCGVTHDTAQLLAGGPPAVTLTATGVGIDLGANATQETPVWAQVDFGTGQMRRHEVISGEIRAGTASIELAKSFLSGPDYDVLALASGHEPVAMANQTV